MRVTDQVSAMECLGSNPFEVLLVPRFFGILIASTVLLLSGLLVSVGSSILAANLLYGINIYEYLEGIPRFVDLYTVGSSVIRCLIYGGIVALISCYYGFFATGGAVGVGTAVTRSATQINLVIVVANFVTAGLANWLIAMLKKGVEFGS
jgi:phospholipid/cholesterol/gamma-HCH transport system permease protein